MFYWTSVASCPLRRVAVVASQSPQMTSCTDVHLIILAAPTARASSAGRGSTVLWSPDRLGFNKQVVQTNIVWTDFSVMGNGVCVLTPKAFADKGCLLLLINNVTIGSEKSLNLATILPSWQQRIEPSCLCTKQNISPEHYVATEHFSPEQYSLFT